MGLNIYKEFEFSEGIILIGYPITGHGIVRTFWPSSRVVEVLMFSFFSFSSVITI